MQCNVSRTVVEHAYRDRVNWLTVVLRDRALTPRTFVPAPKTAIVDICPLRIVLRLWLAIGLELRLLGLWLGFSDQS